MTIHAIYKKCLNCGYIYSWNPDVGLWKCPKCGSANGFTVDRSMQDLSLANRIRLWKIAREIKKEQSKI